jgi:uncharacterized protein YuzE
LEKAELMRNIEVDYDSVGDVLYISFGKPQEADDSDITDEGVIIRLKEGKIVGLTILNASKRMPEITRKAKAQNKGSERRGISD